MTWLIPMGILSNQACHVRCNLVARQFSWVDEEEAVELQHECFGRAELVDQALGIVLYVPGPLPGIAFGKVSVARIQLVGVERLLPLALAVAGAHHLQAVIEEITVVLGPTGEECIILFVSERLGHLGCAVVVVAGFHRAGNAF